jgi:hypothetical protein
VSSRLLWLGTRNHLIVTARLLARGVVDPCPRRLKDVLRDPLRRELVLREAVVRGWDGESETLHAELRIPKGAIAMAHEYVATGGDPHLRAVHQPDESMTVDLLFRAPAGLMLRGRVAIPALEDEHLDFFILWEPVTAGGPSTALRDGLSGLPYLIVGRASLEALAPASGDRR